MDKQAQLDKVQQKIKDELVCPLKDAATNLVFGKGNPDAQILFIGEAPGHKEDLQGIPFVGAAGKELDKLLYSIGLTIDDVYIANILKYRPPNNRDPTDEDIARHTPYLVEQIKIIKPKVIVTLGNFATKFVLAGFDIAKMKDIPGMTQVHGKARQINVDGLKLTVMPIFHPAAMLYKPPLRKVLEEDFQKIKEVLGEDPKDNRNKLTGWLP